MGRQANETKPIKHICAGLLAHVDAGKTTLSEALLYTAGAIRKLGRVDHQDAFLDTDAQERARGITIFSKQAELEFENTKIMLLDTPGHVDFSAEMERTLSVLDYAVLVISGKDGVQGHTGTLWKLLKQYEVPVFLFINKMDLDGTDKEAILNELKRVLDERCVDFTDRETREEQVAMCSEALLEEFLEKGSLSQRALGREIRQRNLFPCYFGSALKMEGVEPFLKGFCALAEAPRYPETFAARVYKITRDSQGNRLTHMKITGGTLHVKQTVAGRGGNDEKEEKVDQIRIYSGEKFRVREQVEAGEICAVTGLTKTLAGEGLGAESFSREAVLEPVLVYRLILPEGSDVHGAFLKLKQLEEEDPQLHITWSSQLQEIQIQLMGQVQLEILKTRIKERFDLDAEFDTGRISYKETIAAPVTGAGHFEPLRHYAEVHLLLEPGERGSGLVLDTACSEDVLDRNWQRLILTHLGEKEHTGPLTGSPITDIKITLLNGRAHVKHTEGGDFRQATYRALQQGLRKAEMILLEPWYDFQMEVPSQMVGRAMSDIQQMGGSFEPPEGSGEMTRLRGKAPVSEMKEYAAEVTSYTKGHGRLICTVSGYEACHNQEQVVSEIGYDVERDLENTADSVFCQHGAGVSIKWGQADAYMHLESGWTPAGENKDSIVGKAAASFSESRGYTGTQQEDKELERIFEKTYGTPKEKTRIPKKTFDAAERKPRKKGERTEEVREEYLLVDGYNIIFAWDELKALAKVNLDAAREALLEILSNYQGYRGCKTIAVFDAYKRKGGQRRHEQYHNIEVVFTKEAETADSYIEKTTYEIGKRYYVRVATSDSLEQMISQGKGAFKVSAKEFREEIRQADAEISSILEAYNRKSNLENRSRIEIPDPDASDKPGT